MEYSVCCAYGIQYVCIMCGAMAFVVFSMYGMCTIYCVGSLVHSMRGVMLVSVGQYVM